MKEEVVEFYPKNQQEWRKWLETNHQTTNAVWLIFDKKKKKRKSPDFRTNLTWSESVDEALCFGWIDSTKQTIDDENYKQYFTKRRPKSNWSKINKDKVKILIDENRMTNAGYESIATAKENGSWTYLDQVEELVLPQDLNKALMDHSGAFTFYEGLSNSIKKQLLYWVISAKKSETRKKRILEIASNASQQQTKKTV